MERLRESVGPDEFPVWKVQILGEYKTPDEYKQAIESREMRLGPYEDVAFRYGALACAQEKYELDLVLLTVADLGFVRSKQKVWYPTQPDLESINRAAQELGLALCPPEVGPALMLNHKAQGRFEKGLFIGMKPFTEKDLIPILRKENKQLGGIYAYREVFVAPFASIFCLGVDSSPDFGLHLSGYHVLYNAGSIRIFDCEDRFVFVKPRLSQKPTRNLRCHLMEKLKQKVMRHVRS